MIRLFLALPVLVLALAAVPVLVPAGAVDAASTTIRNAAENKAYTRALNTADPVARAAALETFLAAYPASVVKIDALEEEMNAYQQANQAGNVEMAASRLLDLDPKNVHALAISVYLTRQEAAPSDAAMLQAIDILAKRGLAALPGWKRPAGLSPATFAAQHVQMNDIFYGAQAFVALASGDYAGARALYLEEQALIANPLDVYQLALADLQRKPLDPAGFWYAAKAIALDRAGASADADKIEAFARANYTRYHGSVDGWDAILAGAAAQGAPPVGFTVTAKP